MQSKTTTVSLLLAGLLATAGAWAETPANATSETSVGGQASTMTQGRPDMATTNGPALATPFPAPTGTLGASTPMATGATPTGPMGAAPALSNGTGRYGTSNAGIVENPATTTTRSMGAAPAGAIPPAPVAAAPDVRLGTGEASTMVNGRPNANPYDPLINKSRAERRTERELERADARTRREDALMGQRGAPEPWRRPGGTPE